MKKSQQTTRQLGMRLNLDTTIYKTYVGMIGIVDDLRDSSMEWHVWLYVKSPRLDYQ